MLLSSKNFTALVPKDIHDATAVVIRYKHIFDFKLPEFITLLNIKITEC